jgi:predicted O-methyltransferase YrrM
MATRLPYPQDHATHLPFLIGIGAAFTIRSVFEFGSGLYSTPLFLNQKAYPNVASMVTIEPDSSWAQKVLETIGSDDRIQFVISDEHHLPEKYDLVFVDNGPEQHKIQTIRNMAELLRDPAIIVVHDAEHAPYRVEIDKFQTKFVSEKYNPGTAICANSYTSVVADLFRGIERIIEQNYHLAVTDVQSWIEVFRG